MILVLVVEVESPSSFLTFCFLGVVLALFGVFFVGIFFSTETPVPTETPLPPKPNPVPSPKDVVQAVAKNNVEITKIKFYFIFIPPLNNIF